MEKGERGKERMKGMKGGRSKGRIRNGLRVRSGGGDCGWRRIDE